MAVPEEKTVDQQLQEAFSQLPPVVQRAITSATVEKRLRELSTKHNLHLDQWQGLENEVMLALLGIQPVETLQKNLEKEVHVDTNTAQALTDAVSKEIFEPIRQELERGLEHPEARKKEMSEVDATRESMLRKDAPAGAVPQPPSGSIAESPPAPPAFAPPPTAPQIKPATPPPPPPAEKATRTPASGAYQAGESSAARKDVHDDPYREPPA